MTTKLNKAQDPFSPVCLVHLFTYILFVYVFIRLSIYLQLSLATDDRYVPCSGLIFGLWVQLGKNFQMTPKMWARVTEFSLTIKVINFNPQSSILTPIIVKLTS